MRYFFPIAIFAAATALGACSDRSDVPVKATANADGSQASPPVEAGPDPAALEALERSVDAANTVVNGPIYIDCSSNGPDFTQYKIQMVDGAWRIFAFNVSENIYVEDKYLQNYSSGRSTWQDVEEVIVTNDEINIKTDPVYSATINRSTGVLTPIGTVDGQTFDNGPRQTCTAAQNHVQSRQF